MTTTIAGTTAPKYRTPEEKRKNDLLYDLEDRVSEDPAFIDDGDIEKISSILGQNRNNNLIYVGKSGVGKSQTISGIAKRKLDTINGTLKEGEKRLPLHMIDRRYLVLDTDVLFGKNDPEVIERDIQNIFTELEKPGDHVLVIEDANQWLKGIEDNQVQGLISTFMRELKKGAFQSVLMVRDEPGKRNLADVMGCHSEMAELFTILEKKAPSKEHVLEVIKSSKASLESHHDGLHITDEANAEFVNLTFLYPNLRIYLQEQPSRSLRMRDQIASTYVSRSQSRPKELDNLEAKLAKADEGLVKTPDDAALLAEKSDLVTKIAGINEIWEKRAHDLGLVYREKRQHEIEIVQYEANLAQKLDDLRTKFKNDHGKDATDADIAALKTADIKETELFLREERKELNAAIEKAKALKAENNDQLTLDVGDVRGFFSEVSGVPAKDMNKNEASLALGLEKRLNDKVLGQEEAVKIVSGTIKRGKAGLNDPDAPQGSIMILGSSGIGKSFLAECLAEELFGDKSALTVIDMGEFKEKQNVSKLTGSTPGLVGFGDGGKLTNAIRTKPHQVVLLDEIEKAHPDVFTILLPFLDKGRLSDEIGTVDCRNVVVIMTTNLGQHMSFDKERTSANSEDDIKTEVRTIFPQELLNRVDSYVLMKAHTPENMERIVGRDFDALNKRMADKGITISIPAQDVTELVQDRYVGKEEEGARQIKKFVKLNMTDKVADIVLENSGLAGGKITVKYNSDKEDFTLDFKPKDVEALKPVPEETSAPELIAAMAPKGSAPAGFGAAASMAWQRAAFAPTYAPMMG